MPLKTSYLESLNRHRYVFSTLEQHAEALSELYNACKSSLIQGGKILFCGNGGSAADCQHLAAEFMVRYKKNRQPLRAISLTTDTSILTAHTNDYDFDSVFERQVQGMADERDVVIGMSTSGNSSNVIKAMTAANKIGAFSVGFSGCGGGILLNTAKLNIVVECTETARIQEAHLFMGHWLCEAFDIEHE